MASHTRATIRRKLRTSLGDWPRDTSTLNGAMSDTTTTVNVAAGDGTYFVQGDRIEIDDEVMRVKSVATDAITVSRGYMGTTPLSHGDATLVEIVENLTNFELNDWIARCFEESYPELYQLTEDTSIAYVMDVRVYTLPANVTSDNLMSIHHETYDGSGFYTEETRYTTKVNKIHLDYSPATGSATKIYWIKSIPELTTDVATTTFPQEVMDAYVAYRDLDDHLRKRAKSDQHTARLDRDAASLYELLNLKRERYNDYKRKLAAAAMSLPAFKLREPKR